MRLGNPFKKVKTPEFYVDMHCEALTALRTRGISENDSRAAFQRRVDATWGLIGLGADSIPATLEMLGSTDSDTREDAAGILGEIGKSAEVLDSLLQALDQETDQVATDSILVALGAMKNKEAIPTLARIIRDDSIDGDTRHTATDSLGKIARKRFTSNDEPIGPAVEWLSKKGL